MKTAGEYTEELLNLAQGLTLSEWDNTYIEFIKRIQTEAWNKAIEAAINKVGNDVFIRYRLEKLKK